MANVVHRLASLPACKVAMENGKILGYGSFTLRTLGGHRYIFLPWTIDESGPAEITGAGCSSLLFLQPNIHFMWIIPAIFAILMLMCAVPMIRLYQMNRRFRRSGCHSKLTWRGLRVDTANGEKKVSLCRFILFLLMLTKITVEGCVDVERIVGTGKSFAVSLRPGEQVCSKDGYLRLQEGKAVLKLIGQYNTSSWSHRRVSEWGCSLGSCPTPEDCSMMRMNAGHLNGSMIIKPFCTNYPRSCAFGSGCWHGEDRVTLGPVMSVFKADTRLLLETTIGLNCKGASSQSIKSSLVNTYIVKKGIEAYVCSEVSARGSPEMGLIGDIQLISQDFLFNWKSIKCDEDWFSSKLCSSTHASEVSSSCIKIPGVYQGLNIQLTQEGLMVTDGDEPRLMVGSCASELISHEEECYGTKIEMIGSKMSGYGLSIIVETCSKSRQGYYILPLNCTLEKILEVPCDCKKHIMMISEDDACTGVVNHVTTSKGFGQLVISEHEPSVVETLGLHNSTYALITGSWLSIMLFILIMFLCCLKR